MTNHTATEVPQNVNNGGIVAIGGPSTVPASPENDWAMANFPFYIDSKGHWGVGATGRWEVVDYPLNNACR